LSIRGLSASRDDKSGLGDIAAISIYRRQRHIRGLIWRGLAEVLPTASTMRSHRKLSVGPTLFC